MDARAQTLLQQLFRRESRSLLEYLTESFPWTPADKHAAVERLHQLSSQQRESTVKLAQFLQRHHIPLPYLGAFPMDFTTINFIGLDYAVPLLVKDEQEAIGELETDLGRLADAEARALVQEILGEKRHLLKELETLGTSLPATTLR
jgi:hypothetical protein